MTILVRVPAETTGGAYTLFEEVSPMVDTPLHVHEREDELFYMLAGEHVFQIGVEEFRAGAFGPEAYAQASENYGITWL